MIINVIYGFLGAGKTTFIRHMMENPPAGEKVVILVNEFGEIGVDGIILSSQGGQVAQVVELPSGCICCTISSDFRRQVRDLYARFAPDRMIVEPTGVATISQILQILEGEDLRPLYTELSLIHILDGSEFLSFVKSHRHFMENQIRRSRLVILNKIDRVKDSMVNLLTESVKQINPDVQVYPTSFGRLEPAILQEVMREKNALEDRAESSHEAEHDTEEDHDHGLADHYQTFGKTLSGLFDQRCLEAFFDDMKNQHYGEIVRAKGIFRTYRNWVKLELASGEVRVEEGPEGTHSVVSVVGRLMNTQEMEAGLSGCREE